MEHSGIDIDSERKSMLPGDKMMLDLLSESTGDCYFFYDGRADTLFFSNNAGQLFGLGSSCPISAWSDLIDRRDRKNVLESIGRLLDGIVSQASINCRVNLLDGRLKWIHINAKGIGSKEDGTIAAIGRISCRYEDDKADPEFGTFPADSLRKALEDSHRRNESGFLLLLDVDNMKIMNLKHGYSYVEDSMRFFVNVLREETDNGRPIYMPSEGCLAIILPSWSEKETRKLYLAVQVRLAPRMTISGGCISLDTYSVPGGNTLLQYAESALYQAKVQGKNLLSIFSPADYEKRIAEIELQEELEESMKNGYEGFFLVFQPQVRARTYELFGAEALLRFRSSRRGVVAPQEFIPILERTGMICQVGLWVLKESMERLKDWRRKKNDFMISVNLSYIQLEEDTIVEDILTLLRQTEVAGSSLIMEITENGKCLDYSRLNEVLMLLKGAGITISADDFGTGYSGLDRIKSACFDEIKIDKSFIRSISSGSHNHRFLGNMIVLARDAGMRVVCEGVETVEELVAIEELEPSLLQGYLFSKPVEAKEFERMYFDASSKEFKERQERENRLRSENDRRAVPIPLNDMSGLDSAIRQMFESVTDTIYITDMDTYDLCYISPAGRKLFNVTDDGKIRKCYKVFHGLSAPCPFCTIDKLEKQGMCLWEHCNEYIGHYFILKDTIRVQEGRRLKLTIALDLTSSHIYGSIVEDKAFLRDHSISSIESFFREKDIGKAINEGLAALGEFHSADRTYLIFVTKDNDWLYDSEWCAPSVPSLLAERRVAISLENREFSAETLGADGNFSLFNNKSFAKSSPVLAARLDKNGIRRLFTVSISDEGRFAFFLGMDNPRRAISDDTEARILGSCFLARMKDEGYGIFHKEEKHGETGKEQNSGTD